MTAIALAFSLRFHAIVKPCAGYFASAAVAIATCLGVWTQAGRAQTPQDVVLQVGVVQRFGTAPTDKVVLEALPGSSLTLRFLAGDGQPKALQVGSVTLEIALRPLPEPVVEERVIFSTHRSFESAEHAANTWRSLGVEVELAQPDRWQVWAKRDVYDTPLLRRLLLESVRDRGNADARLETRMLRQTPVVSWVVGEFRYNRAELDISASNGVVRAIAADGTYTYAGTLHIQPNAYGNYTLVNRVPLEMYLRGVVPYEIGSWAPQEALKAQAIIARTYALRNLRRFAIDNYQLCADQNCQVYGGLERTTPGIDAAIADTQHLVLTYQNELIDALYFASSGGITAAYTDAWEGEPRPYLQPVVDAVEPIWNLEGNSLADEANIRRFLSLDRGFNGAEWDAFRWEGTNTLEEITAFLKRYLERKGSSLKEFNRVQSVRVVERSPSGRILKMEVQTDRHMIPIPADEVRQAFDPPISTLFYIDPVYNPDNTLKGYRFVGGGFGHGVGLSQSSAHDLAKLGWTSDRILAFYYPGTQLQRLNGAIVYWREPE